MTARIRCIIDRFIRQQDGSTAIEYGLIAALVFLVMVAAVQQFAANTVDMWNFIAGKLK